MISWLFMDPKILAISNSAILTLKHLKYESYYICISIEFIWHVQKSISWPLNAVTLSVLNQKRDIKVGFHLNWAFLREVHTDQESSPHPGGPCVCQNLSDDVIMFLLNPFERCTSTPNLKPFEKHFISLLSCSNKIKWNVYHYRRSDPLKW